MKMLGADRQMASRNSGLMLWRTVTEEMTEWMGCGWWVGDTLDMGRARESKGQNPGGSQLLTGRQRKEFHEGDWEGAAQVVEGESERVQPPLRRVCSFS